MFSAASHAFCSNSNKIRIKSLINRCFKKTALEIVLKIATEVAKNAAKSNKNCLTVYKQCLRNPNSTSAFYNGALLSAFAVI